MRLSILLHSIISLLDALLCDKYMHCSLIIILMVHGKYVKRREETAFSRILSRPLPVILQDMHFCFRKQMKCFNLQSYFCLSIFYSNLFYIITINIKWFIDNIVRMNMLFS